MGCESGTRTVPEISAHEAKRTRIIRIVSRILLAIAGDVNYNGLTDTDKATGPTYRPVFGIRNIRARTDCEGQGRQLVCKHELKDKAMFLVERCRGWMAQRA